MNAKRWLGPCVLLLSLLWGRSASATVGATTSPIAVGNVDVGTMATTTGTLTRIDTNLLSGEVASFDLTATGCGAFMVTPTSGSLPVTLNGSGTLQITVGFSPSVRGAQTCTVTVRGTGGGANGTFQVTGTGVAPVVSVAPTSFDYGAVRKTTGSSSHAFTISNSTSDGKNLIVSSITFGGGAAADYSLASPPTFPFTLSQGNSQNVNVVFQPSVTGARSATMTISSNDPITPNQVVILTGTGTSPSIANDGNFDYGVVNNAGAGSSHNIAVSNAGTGVLTVSSATITPATAGSTWFQFTGSPTASCANQTSCTFSPALSVSTTAQNVQVRCKPTPATATGTQTATVVFTSDSDTAGGNTLTLTCTAGRPMVAVSATALAFGDQLVGTPSTARTVTISNSGNSPLTIAGFTKSGTNQADFAISSTCASFPCSIAAGSTGTLTVVFTPAATGSRTAAVNFTTNDPDNPSLSIALAGNGIAPQLSITAPAAGLLTFGNVERGAFSAAQMVTATNTGTADLVISGVALAAGGADYAITSGTTTSQTLPPSGSASWMIVCQPSAVGSRTGTFQITSTNSQTAKVQSVSLSCTGQEGILATSTSSFDFGAVRQGFTSTTTVTLRNTGNVPVTGIMASLSNAIVGYSVNPATVPTSLAAGATASVQVVFAPQNGTDGGPVTLTFSGVWGASNSPTAGTFTLNGDGQAAGFDVNPGTVAFGDVRWDTPATQTFTLTNTDQATLAISSLSIAPMLGTLTGEFSVTNIKLGATTVTTPFTLTSGAVATVTVRAAPQNRTGMMGAVLTATSDLAVNPTRTVTLTATSTAPMVALNPTSSMVDFGAVDVDAATGVAFDVVLTNAGNATMGVSPITTTSGNGTFTYAFTQPAQLAAGEALTIHVTYKPTVVRADSARIDIPLTNIFGAAGGRLTQSITLQGRGIDRVFAITAQPTFPDTFRNPGDSAPVGAVTVKNDGEATLHITAVMITGEPVWTLLDAASVDIPGGGTQDFRVRFAPTAAGPAPAGTLTLMNDDDARPMATVDLKGMGLSRDVLVSPATIDLGYTGIGIPVTLSQRAGAELLTIASMDATHAFKIRELTIDGGEGAFELVDAPANADLPASGRRTVDVRFTPDKEGDFTATVTLYLDQDPTATAQVTVRGHGVQVDAHGGGGCSTGQPVGGGALLLLGAVALATRRRRATAVAAAAIGAAGLGGVGAAEPTRNIDLATFNPTPATTADTFQLQSPAVGAAGEWVLGASFSYATNLLEVDGAGMTDRPIAKRTMALLGGAYALAGKFEVGARLPLYQQAGDAPAFSGLQAASGTAVGDLTVHAKARLWQRRALSAGASLAVTVPTHSADQFAGVASPTGRVLGLAGWRGGRLAAAANLGALVRGKAQLGNVEQGSALSWGAGASFRALDKLWLAGEVFGDLALASAQRGNASPVEALLGVHLRLQQAVTVGVAAGRGLVAGLGAPDLRGVLTMTYAPGARELAPIHPPPPPKIDGDADGDGLKDSVDKCPQEAEDKDLFDDTDGCPEADNDGDAIPDTADRCPIEAEDKDGFEDGDGCPDRDNDRDGIPDELDKCAKDPEDKDGFQDADGCPDLDNDSDGIPDDQDKCPAEAEAINGNKDDDGCPDQGDALIVLSPDRIEQLEPVSFVGKTSKIDKESANVLGQLAATLRAHPEIVRIRITAHVQPSDPAADQELSDKRAASVRDWLVQWGIAASRLDARGFGGTKPLVPPSSKNAALVNTRLELIVLERR